MVYCYYRSPSLRSEWAMNIKAYKYRIGANKVTTEKLQWVLDRCRELYNAALSERKDAYKYAGKSISVYEQKRDLVEIKEVLRPEYQDIASHVLQDVLFRINKAYKRFFERVQRGEKPGYPRFKGRNWYDSFTYPDGAGWKLEGKRLHLSKIGTLKSGSIELSKVVSRHSLSNARENTGTVCLPVKFRMKRCLFPMRM